MSGILKAGVIGWPVAHSLSPTLHSYWLNKYKIEGSYELMPLEPHRVGEAIQTLHARGFCGANVTVPHKEFAAQGMDKLDETATALGAVNLINVHKDGKLEGRNTDGFGFVENLTASAPGLDLKGARVCILGAGGTTRAAGFALLKEGAELRISNRTMEKSEALAELLQAQAGGDITIVPWSERSQALEGISFLVNTTSLGMVGQPALEIDLAALPKDAVVTDCVYAPLETDLLKAARVRGNVGVDGLGMLIHQARPAFKSWFGVDPEVSDDLRDALIAKQRENTV